ncbi:hypothetical protein [Lyngbya sp. CCY1209]|uniref:hypothetical protein n=1 Tax=Lyngbya sp. CCY1209 TaxID=2886103 RepID=UPI002D20F449|nr:hypothetical protein [Lyngbya sp. CCY1209]MEB3882075.1 hypothetical protein [Lyngbya sp. CCY1209]
MIAWANAAQNVSTKRYKFLETFRSLSDIILGMEAENRIARYRRLGRSRLIYAIVGGNLSLTGGQIV